ncbi:MAG: hypothetical protein WEA04_03325 [Candidatus Andersenbacteria bacterium]
MIRVSANFLRALLLINVLLLTPGVTFIAQASAFDTGFNALQSEISSFGLPDTSLTDTLVWIINWLLALVGVIAVLALIISGGRLIIGFGTEEQMAGAKKIIFWAVIGITIVVLAWVIINLVIKEFLGA